MSNETAPESRAWYDKKRFLIPLLIFLFPVGLYALYKNRQWSTRTKMIVASGFALVLVAGALTNADKDAETNARTGRADMQRGPGGIWQEPSRACELMNDDRLGTNGYTKIDGSTYVCTASKTVTEMSEGTGYKENVLEYGVWGSTASRLDSITLDLEIMAPGEADNVRPLLGTHAFGLVRSAFGRDLPEEVAAMIRENETGTWSGQDLRMTVKRMPYGNADGEEYKLLIQPVSQH